MSFLLRLTHTTGSNLRLQRSIFTLPDLSSFSPFSDPRGSNEEPQRYNERKILPYTPSQLYDVVSDVNSYPHFLPFCTSTRILSRSPAAPSTLSASSHSQSMEVELTVGFLSFKETYNSRVTCRPNESVEVVASTSTPLFNALNTMWRFQPASPQSPHLSGRRPLSTLLPSSPQTAEVAENGPTLVTLDLAFSFASPVHAAVSAAFFGQVSKMMVQAFERRCMELYGPGEK
ncbi:dehydrase and lipid transport-domain-containing protein [Sparassis latifolia]|uniref:Coenzyme Q-binding protein COQ10 START domain-containing protein n=1 Tax=Sparassis crispa TaxID=139825 RepID=A0A401GCC8_9APHY|nr:hypothetical protein SCP_0210470 [Sparassis crispa]GBE79846.1 hypothetical protein SCP_0210470 [Sparassis crispa]